MTIIAPTSDFGDAPDSYGTTLASSGARHTATGPLLGSARDTEADAATPLDGTGDDVTVSDDEDGVIFPNPLVVGTTTDIQVTSSVGGGKLDAFFDFDGNGVFNESAIQVTLTGGTETVGIPIPGGAQLGSTYARFRISTAGGLSATGAAADGEVEDYAVTLVVPLDLIIDADDPGGNGTGNTTADEFLVVVNGAALEIYLDGNFSQSKPLVGVNSVTFNGSGANDTVIVDYGGGNPIPTGGITFNGSGQTGAPGDSLSIVGAALTNQTITFTGQDSQGGGTGFDGNMNLDGAAITFTGLEPIVGGDAVNTTLTLPDGVNNSDAILRNEATAGSIEIVGSTFEDTTIPNPSATLTINLGNSNNTLTIQDLDDAFAADITVNGEAGDDVVDVEGLDTGNSFDLSLLLGAAGTDAATFQTTATNLRGGNYDVDATAIDVDIAIDTTGSGTVTMDATRKIAATADITTVNGNITLTANAGATTGTFMGIDLDAATISSTDGDIALTGTGGDTASVNIGVRIGNGAVVQSTGTGASSGTITIDGTGGAGAGANYGVYITGTDSKVTSADGNISINGTGGAGLGQSNRGVLLSSGGQVESTGSGADAAEITITGTGGAGTDFNQGVAITGTDSKVTSADGNISNQRHRRRRVRPV